MKEKKTAFAEWKKGERPDDPNHQLTIAKRDTRSYDVLAGTRQQSSTKKRGKRYLMPGRMMNSYSIN